MGKRVNSDGGETEDSPSRISLPEQQSKIFLRSNINRPLNLQHPFPRS
jgi:hypothetical protein